MTERYAPESKVIDRAVAAYVCDTTGTVTLLTGVATGSDYTDRIGRAIDIRTVQVRGMVAPVDSVISDTLARIMIVYDKMPTGALPAITAILTASESSAYMNLSNRDRFFVLADEFFAVAATNNTATQAVAGSPTCHVVDIYRPLNLPAIYNGTGGTIASIQSGAIYLVTVGNEAAGDGAFAALTCRVRFTDC